MEFLLNDDSLENKVKALQCIDNLRWIICDIIHIPMEIFKSFGRIYLKKILKNFKFNFDYLQEKYSSSFGSFFIGFAKNDILFEFC